MSSLVKDVMSLIKTAKRKAIEEAKRTARDVSGEILEISKSIPKQAVGESYDGKKKETTSGLPTLPSFKGFDVAEDVKNLPKDVSGQIVGKKEQPAASPPNTTSGLPSIVEAMLQPSSSSTEGTSKPEKKISLEEEMNRLRDLRDKQKQEWEEQQKAAMNESQAPTRPGAPFTPPSSPQRGPQGPSGGKQKSIEKRKSKH